MNVEGAELVAEVDEGLGADKVTLLALLVATAWFEPSVEQVMCPIVTQAGGT